MVDACAGAYGGKNKYQKNVNTLERLSFQRETLITWTKLKKLGAPRRKENT